MATDQFELDRKYHLDKARAFLEATNPIVQYCMESISTVNFLAELEKEKGAVSAEIKQIRGEVLAKAVQVYFSTLQNDVKYRSRDSNLEFLVSVIEHYQKIEGTPVPEGFAELKKTAYTLTAANMLRRAWLELDSIGYYSPATGDDDFYSSAMAARQAVNEAANKAYELLDRLTQEGPCKNDCLELKTSNSL